MKPVVFKGRAKVFWDLRFLNQNKQQNNQFCKTCTQFKIHEYLEIKIWDNKETRIFITIDIAANYIWSAKCDQIYSQPITSPQCTNLSDKLYPIKIKPIRFGSGKVSLSIYDEFLTNVDLASFWIAIQSQHTIVGQSASQLTCIIDNNGWG